jgi:predicted methyltransferase
MKKIIGFFAFMVCLTGASVVCAHPASEINITVDVNTKMVVALITHNVSDPERHYIDKVDITLNGAEVTTQLISKQDNNVSQTISYLIPDLKPGDVVAVDTHCNKGGTLKKEIKVENK